ncbi:MAG: DUF1631 family protein [Pseudomonadota bacterium]
MTSKNTAEVVQLPSATVSRRVETVRKVKSAVEVRLRLLMTSLSANVADALFEEMRHLDESAAMEIHFDIMRSLRTEQDVLWTHFASQLNRSWLALVNRRDKQPVPDAPHDIAVILRGYSDRNLSHYKILLEELRLRFSSLSGRSVSFHPLLPGNFYVCFWHATEALDLTYAERKLLLPLFNRFVMDRFGQMAAIANQTLAEARVPAVFEQGP